MGAGHLAFGRSLLFLHTPAHEDTALIQLESKKIVKNAPEWMGTARRKERHIHHNTQHKRQFDRETSRLSTYTRRIHTQNRSERATPKIFLLSPLATGPSHHLATRIFSCLPSLSLSATSLLNVE